MGKSGKTPIASPATPAEGTKVNPKWTRFREAISFVIPFRTPRQRVLHSNEPAPRILDEGSIEDGSHLPVVRRLFPPGNGSGDLRDASTSAYDEDSENAAFVVNSFVEMGQLSEKNTEDIDSLKKEYAKVLNLCEEMRTKFILNERELTRVGGELTALKTDFGKVLDAADAYATNCTNDMEVFVTQSKSDLGSFMSVVNSLRGVH